MKRFLILLVALVAFFAPPSYGLGTKVFDNGDRPYRLLAKQYASNANVFPTTDPTPAGTPLALSNALGVSSNDGNVMLAFQAGFTAPLTLTCYYWQYDSVTPANACWIKAAATSTSYQATVDSNYACIIFTVPPNTPFLVMSSAAVTGNVYCSANAATSNPGSSVAGY